MPNLYDIAYGTGLALAAPVWLALPKARRKVLLALRQRMGQGIAAPASDANPAVLIHAVSLGEINATRALVTQLAADRPGLRFVVTVTTETGFARGQQLYGSDPAVTLVRYPLDFSAAIGRLLDSQRPSVAVLMELEVWPNFIYQCRRREIPVLLINGRLTESSFRNYRWARALLAPTFRRLDQVCAQDRKYADRFVALGAPADRVRVTGTMKFDTAEIANAIDGAAELAASVGLSQDNAPLWVCGSTGPGEEELVLRQYALLLKSHPRLRLVMVPRHPDRFDAVADVIRAAGFGLVRRSHSINKTSAVEQANAHGNAAPLPSSDVPPRVVLGDTMGELRKFYSLSTVVFVGRSLVDLGPRQHGSDMIEPAALGKPVVVGPYTHNFAEVMARFVEADAIGVAGDERELGAMAERLLADPGRSAEVGARAREVVRRERGATGRHTEAILAAMGDAWRPGR